MDNYNLLIGIITHGDSSKFVPLRRKVEVDTIQVPRQRGSAHQQNQQDQVWERRSEVYCLQWYILLQLISVFNTFFGIP